jgi:hypothetical protein
MEDSVIEDVPKQSSSWPIYLYIPNLIGKQFSNVVMAPDPFLVVLVPRIEVNLVGHGFCLTGYARIIANGAAFAVAFTNKELFAILYFAR